jgi:hypothetical protein
MFLAALRSARLCLRLREECSKVEVEGADRCADDEEAGPGERRAGPTG